MPFLPNSKFICPRGEALIISHLRFFSSNEVAAISAIIIIIIILSSGKASSLACKTIWQIQINFQVVGIFFYFSGPLEMFKILN